MRGVITVQSDITGYKMYYDSHGVNAYCTVLTLPIEIKSSKQIQASVPSDFDLWANKI